MTTHCGVLILRSKQLLLDYIHSYLSENLKKYAVGGGKNKRVTIDIIKNVKIKVPLTSRGEFDLHKQKEIAGKYKQIMELKNTVKLCKQKINDLSVDIVLFNSDQTTGFKTMTIDQIFDLSVKTNNGSFTKSFIEKHKGNIPVYGASKNENNLIGYVQDNLSSIKYFKNCLTWNIGGSIGKVFLRKGKFSLSENVVPLIIKNVYKDYFDKLYLKLCIEIAGKIQKFGSIFTKASKNKIQNIRINIPVTQQGKFDLSKQKEVAEKHQKIEKIRKSIRMQLEKIENTKVDIGISE